MTAEDDRCAQYIVLGFIGCISVASLRGFMRNMRKVSSRLAFAAISIALGDLS